MSVFSRALMCIGIAGALALGIAGCDKQDDARGKSRIVVGTEATFPPFESRDDKGNFVGYDVDLVNAIGQKAGFEVEWKDLPFDSLIGALQAGQIDMIASGFSITDERKPQVEFSDAYMNAGIALAVRGDEKTITGKDTLKGKVAAVQQGSTGAGATEKLKADGIITDIKYYPTVPLALMELGKGGADVVISDRPTTEACMASMKGNFKMLPESADLQADSYGFAFKKGNTDLANRVNKAMNELRAEGFFDKIAAKHLRPAEAATEAAPAAAK